MHTNSILQRLQSEYSGFSKSFCKLADYILANPNTAAFYSIKELEEYSGVSAATISRFTKELGYSGYAEFQRELAKLVLENVIPMREIKSAIRMEGDNTLQTAVNASITSINQLYTEDLQIQFDQLIQKLHSLDGTLYIAASRSSYSVAYFLSFILKGFMKNVELLSEERGEISNRLAFVSDQDALLAISYARYTQATYEITKFFKSQGCYIGCITDSEDAPLALHADNVLVAKNAANGYCFAGAMTLANAIITALGHFDPEQTVAQMEKQDHIAKSWDIYI